MSEGFPLTPKIAMVGAGAMGSAMLSGWIASEEGTAACLSPKDFTVVEHTPEKARLICDEMGVSAVSDIRSIESSVPDIVVLAVKPQVMDDVLVSLKGIWFDNHESFPSKPLVITVAAGIPTAHFEEVLGDDVRVVRVMPNMPLRVGQGATAVAAGRNATCEDVEFVRGLFSCIGKAYIVEEPQIDAVCALSGGGPAYVAYLIEALRDAGESEGLERDLAEQLAIQTVSGTCMLMDEWGMGPEEVRRAVCSPGGTTLAALSAMEEGGFGDSVALGVSAAVKRAQELAS